jgi:hypothetical protein
MTIKGLYKKVEKLNTDEIAAESIEVSAAGYVENQQDQMYEGINSDGKQRQPAYSPVTVQIKRSKGQRVDVVTLNDTGDFYQGIFVDVRDNTLVIDSGDSKTADLLDKYGEEIFGLTGEFKRTYVNDHLRPAFKQKIESATGLKMKS